MNPLRTLHFMLPLFALVLLIPPTQAQERELRFLAWDEKVAARPIAVAAGEKRTKIQNLHPLQRSEPLRARPIEGKLGLVALDHTTPETATFSVAIPPQAVRLLILLLPDPKAPCGLRGLAFEDSTRSFPWGSFRLLNATDRPILMRLGGVIKALPTGFGPVDFDAPAAGNHPVLLAARENPERPVYSSVWAADPDSRRLVFIIPGTDARLGSIALKVIPEFRLEANPSP